MLSMLRTSFAWRIGVHHQPLLARLHGDEILAPVERELADARLPLHPLAHDGERLLGHRAVGREVVRPLDVDRIDRGRVGELHEIDDPGRLGPDLRHVVLAHDDVAALLELVALGHLRHRHFPLAVRAPALLLDAGLTLRMQLVEADGGRRIGRREHPDRDVHEADLQKALPGRSRSHAVSLLGPLSAVPGSGVNGQADSGSGSGSALGARPSRQSEPDPAALSRLSARALPACAELARASSRRWRQSSESLRPMLATLADAPLTSPRLVYEPKYDGIRALVDVPPAAGAARSPHLVPPRQREDDAVPVDRAARSTRLRATLRVPLLLDGEIVALDDEGRPARVPAPAGTHPSHRATPTSRAVDHAQPVALILFDLLRDGDDDLRGLPLTERRARLEAQLRHARRPRRSALSEQVRGDGARAAGARARPKTGKG